MKMSDSAERSFLLTIAPLLRAALAESSGREDDPFRLPVFKLHTGRAVYDYLKTEAANSYTSAPVELDGYTKPPLKLDHIAPGDSVEKIRNTIQNAAEQYRKLHHSNPQVIFCSGSVIFTVEHHDNRETDLLQNKVALITGAAGAIGSGICEALTDCGCLVAAGDLPGEKLDRFEKESNRRAPGRVIGVSMDVTDPGSVAGAFNQVILTWGGIDIVIINAGIAMVAGLAEMDLKDFQQHEKVNIEGTLLTLAEAGRRLGLQGSGGDIVLISTKNVFSPGAQFGAYSATKAAAHQLCRIASQEFAADQIRVNMVAPDAVFAHGERKSGLWEKVGPDRMRRRGLDEKGLEDYYRGRNLLKVKVTAHHVANAVLFFVTRQTPTTGATIPVDGGLPDATPR